MDFGKRFAKIRNGYLIFGNAFPKFMERHLKFSNAFPWISNFIKVIFLN
jgi:hypothetical protein